MGNVIELNEEPEAVQVLIPESEEYRSAVNALSTYLAGIPLHPDENNQLVQLMVEVTTRKGTDAYKAGFLVGMVGMDYERVRMEEWDG